MIFFDRFGHLVTDGDEEALHHFAAKIGLEREWYQHPGTWKAHHDLTTWKGGTPMTCPYYRGNGTDGRGWPTIGCLAIPQRQISFMAKVSHEATVNKVCLGKYPQCHYFKKQEEDNHER